MKTPNRPSRRTLVANAAALAFVVTAGVAGRVSAPDPAPTPVPVAATPSPNSAVLASVICDLYGPTFVVTIPPGKNPVKLNFGEQGPESAGSTSYGDIDFPPSSGATTARFHLTRLTGTAFLQGPAERPVGRQVPYTCPPLPGDPPGAYR